MTATADLHPAARADLREKVADLARARRAFKSAVADLDAAKLRHEQAFREAHAELIARESVTRVHLGAIEQSLRGLAVDFGTATGELRPVPGVELIHQTKLDYQDADALAWALKTGLAVQLNRKELERIAKASPLPFVTVSDVLACRLATDLDAALAQSEAA